MQKGFHRHGVFDFLSWRLEAEALLKDGSESGVTKDMKCVQYLPDDLTSYEVFVGRLISRNPLTNAIFLPILN